MRTTLTLDDDVAARLRRLRTRGRTFKDVVNDALRAGLDALEEPRPRPRRRRYTTPVSLGGSSFPNLDDVWGVIAAAEGDGHR
jgi:hypothetical protein